MARQGSGHPTQLELEILKVLWNESPLPVREVRARLSKDADRTLAHSSVITMLNIMVRKGYLQRRKVANAFHFSAAAKKKHVARGLLGDLVSRLFDGSPSAMVLNLLETSDFDTAELREIRKIVGRKTGRKTKEQP